MILSWAETAWEDYLYWQITDKKMLKRINTLIADILRHPCTGIGEPEPLKHTGQAIGRGVSILNIGLS